MAWRGKEGERKSKQNNPKATFAIQTFSPLTCSHLILESLAPVT